MQSVNCYMLLLLFPVQVFDNVTIMFNYMVGFGDVCASATPMDIVKIFNSVFSLFDQITDKYNVFKVCCVLFYSFDMLICMNLVKKQFYQLYMIIPNFRFLTFQQRHSVLDRDIVKHHSVKQCIIFMFHR